MDGNVIFSNPLDMYSFFWKPEALNQNTFSVIENGRQQNTKPTFKNAMIFPFFRLPVNKQPAIQFPIKLLNYRQPFFFS